VGDGTTTVVLLAGEFLREAKQFVEDGVHPQLIIRAYRTAATLAVDTVRKMSIRHAHQPRDGELLARSATCSWAAHSRHTHVHARMCHRHRSPNWQVPVCAHARPQHCERGPGRAHIHAAQVRGDDAEQQAGCWREGVFRQDGCGHD
jgi:hypothetical protein